MFQQYLGTGELIIFWQLVMLILGYIILTNYFMSLLLNELSEKLNQEYSKCVKEVEVSSSSDSES